MKVYSFNGQGDIVLSKISVVTAVEFHHQRYAGATTHHFKVLLDAGSPIQQYSFNDIALANKIRAELIEALNSQE